MSDLSEHRSYAHDHEAPDSYAGRVTAVTAPADTPEHLYRLNDRGKPVKSVEHTLAAVTSIVGGLSRRRARSDAGMNDQLGEAELAQLVALRATVDAEITAAVVDLYTDDRSWADLAEALGVTRQAALKRYGPHVAALAPLAGAEAEVARAQARVRRRVLAMVEGADRQ